MSDKPISRPTHIYIPNIRHRINELTRPITTRTTQDYGYDDIDPAYNPTRTITHPPLLDQLRAAISGRIGHPEGGSTAFASRPGARIDALDTLTRIETDTRNWVNQLGGHPRSTAEGNLWYLNGATADMGATDLDFLDHDTRSWHAGAAITSGWDEPAWRPHVPCPNCETTDTLRIRTDPIMGYCTHCGEGWDQATIGILGNHVQAMLDKAGETLVAPGTRGGSGRGLVTGTRPGLLHGARTEDWEVRHDHTETA